MKVYRIEHPEDNQGPFNHDKYGHELQASLAIVWMGTKSIYADIGYALGECPRGPHWLVAAPKLVKLAQTWFPPHVVKECASFGFVLATYEVPEQDEAGEQALYLGRSGTQVLFNALAAKRLAQCDLR